MKKDVRFDRNDLYLIKDYLEGLLEDYFLEDTDTMKRAIEVIDKLIGD